MVFATGVEFVDVIEAFGYLVVAGEAFWSEGAGEGADLVGFEEFVFFFPGIFDPNLELAVVFERTDIHKTGGPNQSFLFELLHQGILLAVEKVADLGDGTLIVDEVDRADGVLGG